MSVLGTIVVKYGPGVSADTSLVVAAADSELNRNLDGSEKSNFGKDDKPFFYVHHDSSVRIVAVKPTSGMVQPMNMVSRSDTSQMLFMDRDSTQELPHIPSSVSAEWYGNDGDLRHAGRELTVAGIVPCIGDISHTFSARLYRLHPPKLDHLKSEDDQYPIGVVVYVEEAL